MSFVGELNDKMKGFYRSKYTASGEERYGAVTQFEVCTVLPRLLPWLRLFVYFGLYSFSTTTVEFNFTKGQ